MPSRFRRSRRDLCHRMQWRVWLRRHRPSYRRHPRHILSPWSQLTASYPCVQTNQFPGAGGTRRPNNHGHPAEMTPWCRNPHRAYTRHPTRGRRRYKGAQSRAWRWVHVYRQNYRKVEWQSSRNEKEHHNRFYKSTTHTSMARMGSRRVNIGLLHLCRWTGSGFK